MSARNRKRKRKPHKCKNHTKVSARGRCTKCGAWICSKCAYIRYGQFFCRDTCTPSLQKGKKEAGGSGFNRKPAGVYVSTLFDKKPRVKTVVLSSFFLIMLFFLLWAIKAGREAENEAKSLKKDKMILSRSIKIKERQIRELKKRLMLVSKENDVKDRNKKDIFNPQKKQTNNILPSGSIIKGINGIPLNFSRGDIHKKQVALTFDGGSFANAAGDILDTLKSRGVMATFFFTGRFIRNNSGLVRRIVSQGHDAGNHSYSHPHLTSWAKDRMNNTLPGIDREKIKNELYKANEAFKRITGRDFDPIWRAPYGEKNNTICRWGQEAGYIHIEWSRGRTWLRNLDTNDWAPDEHHPAYHSPEEVYDKVMGLAGNSKYGINGGILLMHLGTLRKDPDKQVHRIMGKMIDSLRQMGYSFVTVTQMLKSSGVDPEALADIKS